MKNAGIIAIAVLLLSAAAVAGVLTVAAVNNNDSSSDQNSSSSASYSITYVMNGGINSADNPSSYTAGDSVTFKDPSYTGHTFSGWYTDAGFTNKTMGISSGSTGNVIVYAKWVANTYSITYVMNGGINSADNPDRYSTGDKITFDVPVYDGHAFIGWYSDDKFTNEITGVDANTVGDITAYALWEVSSVGLALNYDIDGSVSSSSFFNSTKNLISGTVSYSYLYYRYDKGYLMSYDESYDVTYYAGTSYSYSKTFTETDTYWTGDSEDMSWTMESETQTISTFEGNIECEVWVGTDTSHTETQYIGTESGLAYKIVYNKTTRGSVTAVTYELTGTGYVKTDDTYDVNVYCDKGVNVSGSGTKDAYSEVTLTASVDPGTTFKGWYDESGSLLSESTEYTIDVLLLDTVIYALNDVDPDVQYNIDDQGSVSISPSVSLTDVEWTYESESGTVNVSGPTLSIGTIGKYAVTYTGNLEGGSAYCGYLDVFVDGNVTRTYEWTYSEKDYTTTLSIKYSDFLSYRNDDISRSQGTNAHDLKFVTYDDKYIIELAGKLKVLGEGFSDAEMAQFILNFTQYVEYQYDSDSVGEDEYWKYPLETLFDQNGDCEDTSILFCAIAKACGYDCCMLLFYDHMAAGISVEGISSTYVFTKGGVTYYYCETTSEGWKVGDVPTGYTQNGWKFQKIIVIPDSE